MLRQKEVRINKEILTKKHSDKQRILLLKNVRINKEINAQKQLNKKKRLPIRRNGKRRKRTLMKRKEDKTLAGQYFLVPYSYAAAAPEGSLKMQ